MTFTKIIRIVAYPLFFLLSIISIFFPKDKSLWVFGAWYGQRYSDNSRYLFEYVDTNQPEIRAVWLSRNRDVLRKVREAGKEAYQANSLRGLWTALRAGMVFISSGMLDVNPFACYGAFKVQLWHGIPLKKIGLDDKISENPDLTSFHNALIILRIKLLFLLFPKYDLIISSSPVVTERLSTAFGAKKEQILLTGYPRSDIILKSEPLSVPFIEKLKTEWGVAKFILFAPTFRKDMNGGNLFSEMDMAGLHQLLVKCNAAFLIKLHYVQREQMVLSNDEINLYHIHLISDEESSDINLLLPHIDILITDYSSVFFDFLLLDRPIIFTPFDIDQYAAIDREFYEDYNSATPGPKCKNWNEVIKALSDILKGRDLYGEIRREKLRVYNSYIDVNNCQRIVKEIKLMLQL